METIEREAWQGLEELPATLARRLRPHCRDESELDDAIQETLLRAARYRGRLRTQQNLQAWAVRIGRNVLHDQRRHRGRWTPQGPEGNPPDDGRDARPHLAERDEEPPPLRMGPYEIDAEDAAAIVPGLLAGLRGSDRALLRAYYQGARRGDEAARRCDIPRHLVKVRLFRARQRLGRALRHELAVRHRPLPHAERCAEERP